jgi:hypothetical protein
MRIYKEAATDKRGSNGLLHGFAWLSGVMIVARMLNTSLVSR